VIYKLKHPDPSKEGFVAGVDFCGGFGTTNSLEDAEKLRRTCGCEITTLEGNPVQVVEERMAMKIPGYKDTIPTGPVILRAVVEPKVDSQDKGAADAAPASLSPEVQPDVKPKGPKRRRPRK
jgi:hypothetical protein